MEVVCPTLRAIPLFGSVSVTSPHVSVEAIITLAPPSIDSFVGIYPGFTQHLVIHHILASLAPTTFSATLVSSTGAFFFASTGKQTRTQAKQVCAALCECMFKLTGSKTRGNYKLLRYDA